MSNRVHPPCRSHIFTPPDRFTYTMPSFFSLLSFIPPLISFPILPKSNKPTSAVFSSPPFTEVLIETFTFSRPHNSHRQFSTVPAAPRRALVRQTGFCQIICGARLSPSNSTFLWSQETYNHGSERSQIRNCCDSNHRLGLVSFSFQHITSSKRSQNRTSSSWHDWSPLDSELHWHALVRHLEIYHLAITLQSIRRL